MSDPLAPDIAEQLLDLREPDGGRHAAVTALLAAAAGPALPAELAGEDSALRGFRQSYRSRARRRTGLIAGAVVAILSLGGTAYAAGGDHLPDSVQRTVESLFGGGGGGAPPSVAQGPADRATASPAPARSPSGGTAAAARVEELCRAWELARAVPHAPQVTGEDRRVLADAAKGETGINDYCRDLLGGPPSTAATTQAPGRPGTTKPGNADPGGGAGPSHPVKPSHP